mmetsp:Transcript_2582/g.8658  ORF Transcript_2582/g.8658 Transcript_2582/m.8658 type:complete len:214 (+) Transcript_2582:143-784(+)
MLHVKIRHFRGDLRRVPPHLQDFVLRRIARVAALPPHVDAQILAGAEPHRAAELPVQSVVRAAPRAPERLDLGVEAQPRVEGVAVPAALNADAPLVGPPSAQKLGKPGALGRDAPSRAHVHRAVVRRRHNLARAVCGPEAQCRAVHAMPLVGRRVLEPLTSVHVTQVAVASQAPDLCAYSILVGHAQHRTGNATPKPGPAATTVPLRRGLVQL